MNKEDYVENLENIIKQMLRPLRNVPLSLVIQNISGYRIIPFDDKNPEDIALSNKLQEAARIAGISVNQKGILRPRPNEVGNDIEPFVRDALNRLGYLAKTPTTQSGKRKTTGYPDLEFVDEFNRVNYLECKTFNIENVSTTQRSFYLSPSEDFKVTRDAHHFVLSFEIFVKDREGRNNVYNCRSWKLLSIEDLRVDVKYEFNSDNARMYAKELVLAESKVV